MFQRGNGGDASVHAPPTSEKESRRSPPSDDLYFKSYAHLGIHQEMIRDKVRSESYRNAIALHAPHIRGKVVLDVGCGTAILSIFAAQAGARKVYAVDASDIALLAKEVVAANGYADVITVIHGKIEDVDLGEPVDVIVSEWMGYALLYETMLPSVIRARDRWLRPGGLMLPSHATLYTAPISVGERYDEGVEFWRDVYGIDMSSLIPRARRVALEEPVVEPLSAENVLSRPAEVGEGVGPMFRVSGFGYKGGGVACQVISFDCRSVSEADVGRVRVEFSTHSMMREELHGFALWFDVRFEAVGGAGEGIVLSTAPEVEATHWMQTLLLIDDPIPVQQDSEITATLSMGKAKEFERFLDIELEYRVGTVSGTKTFVMR